MNAMRRLEGGLLLGMTLLLFLFPAPCARGARDGLILCRDLLVPALFPFFVLSSLLIATGTAGRLAGPLTRFTRPCLGIGRAGTAALLLGLVGGYPVGLRTLAELRSRSACSLKEAGRAALFCNNCGPAFFIGAAGAGIFGSREAGLLLMAANGLAAMLLALGLRLACGTVPEDTALPKAEVLPLAQVFADCVSGAFSSVLGVCAYVILFSVLSSLGEALGLLSLIQGCLAPLFPGPQGAALSRSLTLGLLEISTGTAALKDAAGSFAALPLAAFLLGWGGWSVHGQSLTFLRQAGGGFGPYLAAKAVHGLLSAGVLLLLLRVFPLSLPAMASAGPVFPAPLPGRALTAVWLAWGLVFFLRGEKSGGKSRRNRV